ncbi:MAG: type III pantothenate kinase [Oscillospiraceae bacterium]|nr:type III pantothenate kinase [Oscillospiraceae bacterium]
MLLTIDVGNTNMVFGLFSGETLAGSFRLRTAPGITSDEIGILACEYFSRFGFEPGAVEAVIIASVVPQIMYSLNSAMIKYFGREPLVVDSGVESGLRYSPALCSSSERLGSDRSVTAAAAIAKYGAPLIVIDFGTATTVDAVDAAGCYLGGSIGAGLRVCMDALIQGTAMLPRVELSMPGHIIGTSTLEQLQAGVVAGYVGNIEYLITRMKREMGREDVKVVATGGLSRLIYENTSMIDHIDPHLTLEGLRLIYEAKK